MNATFFALFAKDANRNMVLLKHFEKREDMYDYVFRCDNSENNYSTFYIYRCCINKDYFNGDVYSSEPVRYDYEGCIDRNPIVRRMLLRSGLIR